MGIKDWFKGELTVNEGINHARTEEGAFLIDVRRKEDYKDGHVSGAINIPITKLELVKNRVRSMDAPLYIIGSYADEPKQAVKAIKKMGYTNVTCSGRMEDHHGLLKK